MHKIHNYIPTGLELCDYKAISKLKVQSKVQSPVQIPVRSPSPVRIVQPCSVQS